MKTGIDPLDLLLFGDTCDETDCAAEIGFRPGEVVLVRGEPGSGKTTLALQIASGFLKSNPSDTVQYMALEESEDSMNARCRRFNFVIDRIEWTERPKIDALIKSAAAQDKAVIASRAAGIAKTVGQTTSGVTHALATVMPEKTLLATAAEALAPPAVEAAVRGILERLFRRTKRRKGIVPCSRLVVIDSLNALMNLLIREFPSQSTRLLFNTFCQVLREHSMSTNSKDSEITPEPPVILIIGEHHFHELDSEKYLPESFFCDAEIVLRPEALRLPRGADVAANITLGYEIAAIVDPEAKHLESRSFCRVVKSRLSHRQSRRCAYDIEAGQGFRFFETYPGDGKLMLFAENEQQRASWESFFSRDLTDSYPALRYETFTMEGLETVYESSRRLLHLPLSTDMYLSSLDSYWVMGYRDYKLKTRINERLKKRMLSTFDSWTMQRRGNRGAPPQGPRTPASTWACMEYPGFVNDLACYALTQAERDLYSANCQELSRRPRPSRQDGRRRLEERLSWFKQEAERRSQQLNELTLELGNCYDGLCQYLFGTSAAKLCEEKGVLPRRAFGETFLRPLPRSRLSLYGQYNADLVPILVREDMHKFQDGEDHWLSVPYDANIGIFVARLDLLTSKATEGAFAKKYEDVYRQLKRQEQLVFKLAGEMAPALLAGAPDAVPEFRKHADEICAGCTEAEKHGPGPVPTIKDLTEGERLSWDQVICLSAAAGLPFGLETRSFDTLMAFFLELVWNCGGKLEVNGRYKILDLAANVVPLIRAFHYFGAIFKFADTPRDSTIDPCHFGASCNIPQDYGQWLFARYWYSTLLDALTATEPMDAESSSRPRRKEFVWRASAGTRPRVEILAMPKGIADVDHFTCCGDWSFGLLDGSENLALACDLVSNLMGAVKVTDRGLRGACLPTVSQFYWRYRDEPCVPRTIRDDFVLPGMTFGEIGRRYLGTPEPSPARGIMRHCIFDYRHCAREMYGELLGVKRSISGPDSSPEGVCDSDANLVVKACIHTLRGIEELRHRYIFIRDAFRQDVAEMPLQSADRRRDWIGGKPRMRRVALTDTMVKVGRKSVSVLNISPGGCALSGVGDRKNGDRLTVVLESKSVSGEVIWAVDGRLGMAFDKMMPYGEYFDVLEGLRSQGEPNNAFSS
jgi:energy-coupling factor transporter ATP-binding protein EcfA2